MDLILVDDALLLQISKSIILKILQKKEENAPAPDFKHFYGGKQFSQILCGNCPNLNFALVHPDARI